MALQVERIAVFQREDMEIEYTEEFIENVMVHFNDNMLLRSMMKNKNPAVLTFLRRQLMPVTFQEIIDIIELDSPTNQAKLDALYNSAYRERNIRELIRKGELLDRKFEGNDGDQQETL